MRMQKKGGGHVLEPRDFLLAIVFGRHALANVKHAVVNWHLAQALLEIS